MRGGVTRDGRARELTNGDVTWRAADQSASRHPCQPAGFPAARPSGTPYCPWPSGGGGRLCVFISSLRGFSARFARARRVGSSRVTFEAVRVSADAACGKGRRLIVTTVRATSLCDSSAEAQAPE